jgi:acyl-CoA thioesterase
MSPQEIVERMISNDAFSKWLDLEVLSIDFGTCVLTCTVRAEMLNGFQIAHGGISYSLSDSALAFAANSYGKHCVSVETSISHTKPAKISDKLTATCSELHRGKTLGVYQVEIRNQENTLVSLFKGTVFISDKNWE